MDSNEQLELIRDAHGDRALLALATVDLTFPDLPGSERTALRSALEAAAVPHWCDTDILAKLTGDSGSPIPDQWERLKKVPVVEPFPARGADAGNVHESNRLAIRHRLAETEQGRFKELSIRAARVFEADKRPIGRIEWTYHLLVADPERGAAVLEDLDRAWLGTARYEDIAALAAALSELDTAQMLHGKPSVRARLIVAQRRVDLAGAGSLGDLPTQLLQEAEATGDARLIGDAYALAGEVAQARGDLAAAEQAYGQDLAISERMAAMDPANTGWQRDLAGAYSRVGDVAQARGDLAAAEQAYRQELAISEKLAALEPDNTGWPRDLAVAYARIGDVAQARGDLVAAEQAYGQELAISEKLAALDLANTSWQRELAVAYSRVGDVAQARGDLAAAEQAYNQDLAIAERMAAMDPANTTWQRELAVTCARVGDVAQARGDVAAAEQAYRQYLAIFERLAGLDPANTGWQRELAVAYSRVGDMAQARGDVAAAEQAYTQQLAIFERLAALNPANTDWQQNLAIARSRMKNWRRSSRSRRSRPSPDD